jgi:WD40 repeat protein
MGIVYEAEQMSLHRRVALKVLPFASVLDAKQLARFKNEALAAASLDHPHIVDVLGVGCDRGMHFYAMRLIDGCTLADVIAALREGEAPAEPPADTPHSALRTPHLSSTRAVLTTLGLSDTSRRTPDHYRKIAALIADAADALHHAHEQGVIHRDIKPSNLMLDSRGKLWVTDFGLAHVESNASLTMTGDLMGTLRYMSPEQASGSRLGTDHRTDIYSLGVTLYELLTLQPAFSGENRADLLRQIANNDPLPARKHERSIPAELETIIVKSIEKNSRDRYATAVELATDLRHFVADEPIQAKPPTVVQRSAKWARRHRIVVIATFVVACLLLATMALGATLAMVAQTRENLIQRVQLIRLMPHAEGWSNREWNHVQSAARLGTDHSLRSEAVATLAGVDAFIEKDLSRHPASSVAFSPSGRTLAIGGTIQTDHHESRGARVYDRQTDYLQSPSPLAGNGLVGFRGESAVQLVSRDGPSLVLWDVKANRSLQEYHFAAGENASVTKLLLNKLSIVVSALSPGAEFVAAAAKQSDGKSVVVAWNGLTGKRQLSQELGAGALAFSADSRLLAVGGDQGSISVWSLSDAKQLASFSVGRGTIHCLAFSPDGKQLAACGSEGLLEAWDWTIARRLTAFRGSAFDVFSVAFHPDRVTLTSAGRHKGFLWDIATGRPLLELNTGDWASGLAFSPDGGHLACSSFGQFEEGHVQIWTLEEGRGIQTLRGLDTLVVRTWFSPDGRLVAGLSQDWRLAIWDRAAARLLRILDVPRGMTADNAGLAFSPDRKEVAFSTSGAAKLWNISSGKEVRKWELPESLQDNLAYHPSGKLLLFRVETEDMRPFSTPPAQHPRVVRIRDLLQKDYEKPLVTIDEFAGDVFPILVPRDGQFVALRGRELGDDRWLNPTVKVVDSLTREERWTYKPGALVEVRLDPIGSVLTIADAGRTTLVEMTSGKLLEGVPNVVFCVGPNGRHCLGPVPEQDRQPNNIAGALLFRRGRSSPLVELSIDQDGGDGQFSDDGNLLALCHPNGGVSVFDLPAIQKRLAQAGLGW